MHIGNLDVADVIISDDGIPEEYRKYFESRSIPVLTSIADTTKLS